MEDVMKALSRAAVALTATAFVLLGLSNVALAQRNSCNVQQSSAVSTASTASQAAALQNAAVLQALQAQANAPVRASSATAIAGGGPSVAALRAAAAGQTTASAVSGTAIPAPSIDSTAVLNALSTLNAAGIGGGGGGGGGGNSRSVSIARTNNGIQPLRPLQNLRNTQTSKSVAITRTSSR
jgi:hypothetical protein